LAAVIAAIAAAAVTGPAAADEARLRRAFGAFLRSADEFRVEAVPELYEGGYARISVSARRVRVGDGMRIDEATIRLVGVSLDAAALEAGTLKVKELRDSAL